MKMTVRYMAQLKAVVGCATEQVELGAPGSLGELVAQLAERHGTRLTGLLLDAAGRLQPTVLVFVGDHQVPAGQPVTLNDGDVVTLLSPMAGG